jgi:hypothetical protein
VTDRDFFPAAPNFWRLELGCPEVSDVSSDEGNTQATPSLAWCDIRGCVGVRIHAAEDCVRARDCAKEQTVNEGFICEQPCSP